MKHTADTFKADYRGFLPNQAHRDLRPLTDSECKYFLNIMMMDPDKPNERLREEVDKVQAVQIINSRLKHVEVEPDLKTKMFLGCIIKSPGVAVTWAFTLARLAFELKKNPTFDDLFMGPDAFGMGIPTDAKVEEAWTSQKCHAVNLLDWSELWPKWKEAA